MILKKRDLRLLYELDSDYRKPHSKIGARLRMSQQLISYKVRMFTENGIIQGYYPLIDYSRFGYLSFLVFFKLNYLAGESLDNLVSRMTAHENITSIYECEGKYDLAVVFAARNPSSFNKMLRKLISEHPRQLRNCVILSMVVEHHFPRSYLVGSTSRGDIVIGGDREDMAFDESAMKMVEALVMGKRKITDIAEHSGLSVKTAMVRLKSMQRQEVVNGYRLLLSPREMGMRSNLVLIRYRNVSADREDEFRDFCVGNPNVVDFRKTFGEWDVVINVETKGGLEFRGFYLRIREQFEDLIEDTEKIEVFAVRKMQYLPQEALGRATVS